MSTCYVMYTVIRCLQFKENRPLRHYHSSRNVSLCFQENCFARKKGACGSYNRPQNGNILRLWSVTVGHSSVYHVWADRRPVCFRIAGCSSTGCSYVSNRRACLRDLTVVISGQTSYHFGSRLKLQIYFSLCEQRA